VREDAWLAEQLGMPVHTVEPGDAALDAGPGLYQAKVPCADLARLRALEDAGMRVVDVNVTLRRPAGPSGVDTTGVRDARPADRDAILTLAERDYPGSRFHLDPQIPDERANALKRAWVDGFFAGARGDRMLVADRDGEAIGFYLVIDGDDHRTGDLLAVVPGARRAGTATALVGTALDMRPLRDHQMGTQVSNIPSLRFFERLGFSIVDSRYVLHGHVG
jgi:ribosomal protein S18 acetylase RimI-like enzyme